MNEVKNEKEIETHLKNHKDEVSDEIIDVLYWTLLLSKDLNINLEKAFARKMKINAQKYPVTKSKGKHSKYKDLK